MKIENGDKMKKTIKDFNLENKRVIIRCDFNVPIQEGKIIDDTRIKESLSTIQYAINQKAKVILLSHLGRIKSLEDLKKSSLLPVSTRLSELLEKQVLFIPKTRGREVEEAIANMQDGDIILLENTRFEDLENKKESSNDKELATYWASLGDIFINDAFGTIHRNHASNVGIASILPSGIGLLVEKELKELGKLDSPSHPYIVILGGSKVSDKIGVITNLVKKADNILIGGGMAFTFLKALGYKIGNSILDMQNVDFCKDILEKYQDKIILPVDIRVSKNIESSEESQIVDIGNIDSDEIGLDIGPKSIELFQKYLKNASIVVWNGPLGMYEIEEYSIGTREILKYLEEHSIETILGGGDIVAASRKLGYMDKMSHVSTGGGATLEYLEGKNLSGLAMIKEN